MQILSFLVELSWKVSQSMFGPQTLLTSIVSKRSIIQHAGIRKKKKKSNKTICTEWVYLPGYRGPSKKASLRSSCQNQCFPLKSDCFLNSKIMQKLSVHYLQPPLCYGHSTSLMRSESAAYTSALF